MLKLYVRHGMVVHKINEINSFNQSKWLEEYLALNSQKHDVANVFEKDFYKLMNNGFYGKTMENVNRSKRKFVEKDEEIKKQSTLTFNGTHESYTNYDSYTFKQIEVLMDKPIYLGFAMLKMSKFLMYGTYYDKVRPMFGEKKHTNTPNRY